MYNFLSQLTPEEKAARWEKFQKKSVALDKELKELMGNNEQKILATSSKNN